MTMVTNRVVNDWVKEMAEMTKPDDIVWLDGSKEQLEQISAFARRPLAADEVYVFSMILCDNEIDRDYERFPRQSLEVLGRLFIGKTGIFDHNPKGENQTARIFQTTVECDTHRHTQNNEPYCALRAWAYMVRCAFWRLTRGLKRKSASAALSRARSVPSAGPIPETNRARISQASSITVRFAGTN